MDLQFRTTQGISPLHGNSACPSSASKQKEKVCVPILPHFPLRGLIYLLLSPTQFVCHSLWLAFSGLLADFGHLAVLACIAPCALILSREFPDSGKLTAGHSQDFLLTRNRTQWKQKGRGKRKKEKTVEMERPRAKGSLCEFLLLPSSGCRSLQGSLFQNLLHFSVSGYS